MLDSPRCNQADCPNQAAQIGLARVAYSPTFGHFAGPPSPKWTFETGSKQRPYTTNAIRIVPVICHVGQG